MPSEGLEDEAPNIKGRVGHPGEKMLYLNPATKHNTPPFSAPSEATPHRLADASMSANMSQLWRSTGDTGHIHARIYDYRK